MSKRTTKSKTEIESTVAPSTVDTLGQNGGADQTAIAELAYKRWIERGCPQGTAEEDWLSAEKEVKSKAVAGRPTD